MRRDLEPPPRLDRPIGVPMLVGSLTYDFHRDGLSKYNSAILFEPGVDDDPELSQAPPRPVRRVRPADRDVPLADRADALPRRTHVPEPDLRPRAGLVRPRALPARHRHLLRGHRPPGRPPVLRATADGRPTARRPAQPLERRLVPRLVGARHAPGRQRLPGRREPRPARPRGQHRHLGARSTATAGSSPRSPSSHEGVLPASSRSTTASASTRPGATGSACPAWPSPSACVALARLRRSGDASPPTARS